MQLKKAPAPTLTENGKAASESNGTPPKKTKPQRIVGVHSVGHYTLWFHAQSAQRELQELQELQGQTTH